MSHILINALFLPLDFRQRFISLLSYQFREFTPHLCLNLIRDTETSSNDLLHDGLKNLLNHYDLKRLELYSRNMADHHLITDLLPTCGLSWLQ